MNQPLEVRVREMLIDIGVSANLKGYEYLVRAIMAVIYDRDLLYHVMYKLYPLSAKANDMSAGRQAERTMRHAIKKAWDRHDAVKKMFWSKDKCPCTSEFIATIAELIKYGGGKIG